jgi:hypothetical protein
MNLDDSSKHSASVLSKGLDGDSPQFERKIPVYFGGSMHSKGVSSKGLKIAAAHTLGRMFQYILVAACIPRMCHQKGCIVTSRTAGGIWIVMAACIARMCCRKGSIVTCTRRKLRIDPIGSFDFRGIDIKK